MRRWQVGAEDARRQFNAAPENSIALIDACDKRAQPIVMTSIAMTAGVLPIALGFGADASFRQAMGVAIIGGLLSSTALSHLVVPVLFIYVDGMERWFVKLLGRVRASGTTDHEPARGSARGGGPDFFRLKR